ncbi:MAG: hypothetical protein PHR28_02100 [candidate division Zixibacteria bacterium]|nr:hypothetical protein [candidate division Zixibacteria bacterium]
MKRLPIVVILIASLMNLTVGCGNEKTPVTSAEIASGQSNEFLKDAPGETIDDPADVPTPMFSTVLPNGDSVTVENAYLMFDTVVVELTVVNPTEPAAKHRILKINNSLTGIIYTGIDGVPLAGYDVVGQGDTLATLNSWTPDDQFTMAVCKSNFGIRLQAADRENSCTVAFADSAELETAKALYNELYVAGTMQKSNLTAYELDIVSRVNAWATYIASVTFNDGSDLQTAELIMAQESFVDFIGGQFGPQLFRHCGIGCICGLAGMISTACIGLMGWCIPCWAVCVPAIGIATACAIAEFIGDVFSENTGGFYESIGLGSSIRNGSWPVMHLLGHKIPDC